MPPVVERCVCREVDTFAHGSSLIDDTKTLGRFCPTKSGVCCPESTSYARHVAFLNHTTGPCAPNRASELASAREHGSNGNRHRRSTWFAVRRPTLSPDRMSESA